MANYNRVILVGNLTRDPRLSYLPNQTPVAELGLAVSRKWKDAQGNAKEETCFIDCNVFGKQADTVNKYLKKGRQVLIEGRLQFSMWEAKDGTKRSKHRVVVDHFQFLGEPSGAARGAAPRPAAAPPQAAAAPMAASAMEETPEPPPMDEEPPPTGEDIPF
jgi:single-strand DNA-binding protein